MSASGSAISTTERIAAWAREERMRMTSKVPADSRKARSQEQQADILLRMENYANRIRAHLESEARVGSIAWQRARTKGIVYYDNATSLGEGIIDRAIKTVRR